MPAGRLQHCWHMCGELKTETAMRPCGHCLPARSEPNLGASTAAAGVLLYHYSRRHQAVLLQAMSYRTGHHSISDDSSR